VGQRAHADAPTRDALRGLHALGRRAQALARDGLPVRHRHPEERAHGTGASLFNYAELKFPT
jgi:hypothetical protein